MTKFYAAEDVAESVGDLR